MAKETALAKYLRRHKLSNYRFAKLSGISIIRVGWLKKNMGPTVKVGTAAQVVKTTKGEVKYEDFLED